MLDHQESVQVLDPASNVSETIAPGRTYVDHMSKDKGLYPSFRPYGKVLVILPIVSWFHYEMGTSAAVIPRSNGKK